MLAPLRVGSCEQQLRGERTSRDALCSTSRTPRASRSRAPVRTCAVWLDNVARVEAKGVPLSLAFSMWLNKGDIPQWMPWIASVTVQADPRVSKWCLRTEQFGQQLEFSWLARDLTPVANQKIHWVSDGGLPNRGAVTFFPRGTDGENCALQLSISYELPEILVPVGASVRPIVEGILQADMERFVAIAQQRAREKRLT